MQHPTPCRQPLPSSSLFACFHLPLLEKLYSHCEKVSAFGSDWPNKPSSDAPPPDAHRVAPISTSSYSSLSYNYQLEGPRAPLSHDHDPRVRVGARDATLPSQFSHYGGQQYGIFMPPSYNNFNPPTTSFAPTPVWNYTAAVPPATSPSGLMSSHPYSTLQPTTLSTPTLSQYTPMPHQSPSNFTAPNENRPVREQVRFDRGPTGSFVKLENECLQLPYRPAQPNYPEHRFNPSSTHESPGGNGSTKRRKSEQNLGYGQEYRDIPTATTIPPLPNTQYVRPRTGSIGNNIMHGVRKSNSPALTDEEQLLLDLREKHDPKPDWKTTVKMFNERTGKNHKVPALQMKFTRLKEKMREWTTQDLGNNALSSSQIRNIVPVLHDAPADANRQAGQDSRTTDGQRYWTDDDNNSWRR